MKRVRFFGALLVVAMMVMPRMAQACPACSDAIAAASEGADVETDDFPRAMNQSIMLMVGVPYVSLGIVSFLIYRGCKQNSEFQQDRHEPPHDHV